MEQLAAPTSLSIRIVTSIVLLMTGGMLVAAAHHPSMWMVGAGLTLLCVLCYLFAPVSYVLDQERLVVNSHVHSREFTPVVRCSQIKRPERRGMWVGLRLFGNGGLFAGTGIFWNRMYGVFRAYVTSARFSDLVLVETPDRKIVISPENPAAFVEAWIHAASPAGTR